MPETHSNTLSVFIERFDLSGARFNRWRVLGYSHTALRNITYWNCRCDCGTERSVSRNSLRKGLSQSCGCLRGDRVRAALTLHGMGDSREYNTWTQMIQRCTNPKAAEYHRYGQRGITVCPRWRRFTNFYADMGERPTGKTLDRYPDKNGNYEKSNCRWATLKEQANNTSRNIRVGFEGRIQTMAEWSEEKRIPYDVLYVRLTQRPERWNVRRALTTPVASDRKDRWALRRRNDYTSPQVLD